MLAVQGMRLDNASVPYFLLTPRNFNVRKTSTIDELRQRRFSDRSKRNRTMKSSTRENWMRAFFLPFQAMRESMIFGCWGLTVRRQQVTTMMRDTEA